MNSLVKAFAIASLCLASFSTGRAATDAKEIPVQPQPVPPAPDEWRFFFTPYAWVPSIQADFSLPEVTIGNRVIGGDFSVDQPWWDTISNFSSDFYVLTLDGRFEAWKGRWGGFVDGYWMFGKVKVGNSDSRLVLRDRVDVTASSSVTTRFDFGQFNFGPQFELANLPLGKNSSVSFVTYGGGRVNWAGVDIDGSLTIRASANIGEVGQTFRFSKDTGRAYVEPMIGLKSRWVLGPHVVAEVRGDVAGFGWVYEDNWDCDLEAALAWEAFRNVYLDLGYRARGQWQDLGSRDKATVSGWFHGPELGITFSF